MAGDLLNLQRIALGVSYSGSAYQGWQSQLSGLTVQDKLEGALSRFTASPLREQLTRLALLSG